MSARVTAYRYRGVDQAARMVAKWAFLELAAVELAILTTGRCRSPTGIAAVGQVFAEAGVTADHPWTLAPHRVGIGRVPVGVDEQPARALVRIGTTPGLTIQEPVIGVSPPMTG
jgi:hypothetical protein